MIVSVLSHLLLTKLKFYNVNIFVTCPLGFTTINGNTSITNTGGPTRRLLYAEAAVINNNVMSTNDQVSIRFLNYI